MDPKAEDSHREDDKSQTWNDKGTSTTKSERKAWVRYRTEYRHRITDEVIYRQDCESFGTQHTGIESDDAGLPAFELVTRYMTKTLDDDRRTNSKNASTGPPAVSTLFKPSYRLNLFSTAIIHAVRSVVKYYPSQDLNGDTITVDWPYAVLVHHYDELLAFRKECVTKDPSVLCVRERDADEHLGLLLQFLDDHIMEDVRAEQERNRRGVGTFEFKWFWYKPGMTFLYRTTDGTDWQPCVIQSVTGGIFENLLTHWTMNRWSLRYDGHFLGRVSSQTTIKKFDGEVKLEDNIYVDDLYFGVADVERNPNTNTNWDPLVSKQIENGRMYWKLLRKQCRYYKGNSRDFPFNEVDGLVMADLKSYMSEGIYHRKPTLMNRDDLRIWDPSCYCAVCSVRKDVKSIEPLFERYNRITPDYHTLTRHGYFLCDFTMKAFVFRTRAWETLHVEGFQEPKWDQNMLNSLVMDEQRKNTLKALAKSLARLDKHDVEMTRDMWTADFVKGKGNGTVLLLHGSPGVGKTCTAECIAAFTRRPLMILTAGDIGVTPSEVEVNLNKNFKTARSWDAVLLIDEADVFMERRSTSDLVRNSMVAGFLRALENFDGILFLTTNRVGTFDDAFMSRVHVKLYYPPFTPEQRQRVWKTFMDKLARERGDSIRLNYDAKEYIEKIGSIKWNGREIRNAFQTAVALAEYDAEKDKEGNLVVTDKHFRAVVELSEDFNSYLKDLHRGDEAKRSQRYSERLDTFGKERGSLPA